MLELRTVVIECDRLTLVPTSEAYAADIFHEFTSDITTYMYPKPAGSIDDTLTFLRETRSELEAGNLLPMAVLTKKGEFIGHCGLHLLKSRTPELGIWIKLPAHGNGYGREAVTALAYWALANLDFDYLIYPVDRRNIASRRIPEALGGTVEAEYPKTNASGAVLDIVEYRITPGSLRERR